MIYLNLCKFPSFDAIRFKTSCNAKQFQAALSSPDLNPAGPVSSVSQILSISPIPAGQPTCLTTFSVSQETGVISNHKHAVRQRLIQRSRTLHTASSQPLTIDLLNKITQQIPLPEQQASSDSQCTPYKFHLNLGSVWRGKGGNRYEQKKSI